LRSNLIHALRPLAGDQAPEIAETLAAMIDGLYIRHALGGAPDGQGASARVLACLDRFLSQT
jgi:TetR/AcrR family transcriptional repressor of bet genes